MKNNLLLLALATLFAFNLCGQTWTVQTTPTPLGTLNKIQFVDSLKGWSVGNHTIGTSFIYTNNSGTTWGNQYLPTSFQSSDNEAFYFVNSNYGYAAPRNGGLNMGLIKTTNGGINWSDMSVTPLMLTYSLYFTDTTNGLAGGTGTNNILISKTTDGGVTWSPVWSNGSESIINQIQMVNASIGYACSAVGHVLKTINGGSTWTSYATGYSQSLDGISFLNSNIGWAVGASGIILKTTNGGLNWTSQISGTSNELFSVSFIDTLRGWCCGGTKIYQTSDGGNTWLPQFDATPNTLKCVQMLNSRVGFACGDNGSVYKYSCTPSSSNLVHSICAGQSFSIGTQSFNATGNYSVTLVSNSGCDSIVHLNLTVNPLPVPIITNNAGILSTGIFLNYQWLYNSTIITGQTSQSLTPTYNGNYSVIVTDNKGCSDTSAIYNYTGVGILEMDNLKSVFIYPNPTTTNLTIENITFKNNGNAFIQIYNIQGKLLLQQPMQQQIVDINISSFASGMYYIKVKNEKGIAVKKFIKE